MTEDEFKSKLSESGYGEATFKKWEPHSNGDFHTHEFSALLMVTEGEFRVVYENETKSFTAGEWCEVPAGTVHYEQTGAEGALVMAGTK